MFSHIKVCQCGTKYNILSVKCCPSCVPPVKFNVGFGNQKRYVESHKYIKIMPDEIKLIEGSLDSLIVQVKRFNCKTRTPEIIKEKVNLIITLRDIHHLSFNKISQLFHYKDHTTVAYLYKRYNKK